MKSEQIHVGGIYINRGKGRTFRKVLAIGDAYRPAKWLGKPGSIPPDEPGVRYEQELKDGSAFHSNAYISSFAQWAKGET